jgi:hypothetical protein
MTDCPICESPDTAVVPSNGMTFHRCNDCELLFRDPLPSQEELDHFYQHEYRQEAPDSPRMANYFRAQADHRIAILSSHGTRTAEDEWVPALPQEGGALDIGAGVGTFVDRLNERGWTAGGIEPNPEYSAKSGAVKMMSFEDACKLSKFPVGLTEKGDVLFGAPYHANLVTMFHVLEHLRDPVGVLESVKGMLSKRPDSRLWIEVPNSDTPLRGKIENEYTYPHLWVFNRLSLINAMMQAGWDVCETWTDKDEYTGRTSLHAIGRLP